MLCWQNGETTGAQWFFKKGIGISHEGTPFSKLYNFLINTMTLNGEIIRIPSQRYMLNKWSREYNVITQMPPQICSTISSADDCIADIFNELKVIKDEIINLKQDRPTTSVLKDNNVFITNSKIRIKPGPYRKGILIINSIFISISPIESDICVAMAKQSLKDWQDTEELDPMKVGWVSYESFRGAVSEWYKKSIVSGTSKPSEQKSNRDVISDQVITNAINRLNIKIRTKLEITRRDKDLIENGNNSRAGYVKHYRFRIHPRLIMIDD